MCPKRPPDTASIQPEYSLSTASALNRASYEVYEATAASLSATCVACPEIGTIVTEAL
jgi:hypothetical protein